MVIGVLLLLIFSFGGWYLSLELSRKTKGAVSSIAKLGDHCKAISEALPVLISPWIDGKKAVVAASNQITKNSSISLKEHEQEWDEIFDGIKDSIDIVAFQDGHVGYNDLEDYLRLNKSLADKYGLQSWTNSESFDRDMPIKFLPIKWEKLLFKLEAAKKAGCEKAITFERKVCGEKFISDTPWGPMIHARLGIAEENSGLLVSQLRQEARQMAKEKKIPLPVSNPEGVFINKSLSLHSYWQASVVFTRFRLWSFVQTSLLVLLRFSAVAII